MTYKAEISQAVNTVEKAPFSTKSKIEVTKNEPCRHCGKPDWCYRLDEVEVCNRNGLADGWYKTAKVDANSEHYLAPARENKQPRPKQRRYFNYRDREGNWIVRVGREDKGNGKKKIWQEQYKDGSWVFGIKDINREDIPLYNLISVKHQIELGLPVFVVEGEACVDALAGMGIIATTNIGGSSKVTDSDLADLKGAKLVICPDRDKPGVKHALDIYKKFPDAQFLLVYPDTPAWDKLPDSGGLDIVDYIKDYPVDARHIAGMVMEITPELIARLERQVFGATQWTEPDKLEQEQKDKEKALRSEQYNARDSRKAINYAIVEYEIGDRLKFNLLRQEIELDGKPMRTSGLSIYIALKCKIDMSESDAYNIVLMLAEYNSYHPVRDYLDEVKQKHTDTAILQDLATRYFGTPDPLYDTYLRKQLIGAVARVFKPGCKLDTATILQGKQGFRKSTFWETLIGREFFEDAIGDSSNKDELMKMQRVWGVEYGEFESVYTRKEQAALKAFMATTHDSIRRPYERKTESVPRGCFLVGSTNQIEFLNDATGARRFWVIPVQKRIDTELLKSERDAIWGAAVQLYLKGETWYLTGEEDDVSSEVVELHKVADTWFPHVESHVKNQEWVEVGAILQYSCLDIEPAKHDRIAEKRVKDILTTLGWEKKRKTIDGRKITVYVSPTANAVKLSTKQSAIEEIHRVHLASNQSFTEQEFEAWQNEQDTQDTNFSETFRENEPIVPHGEKASFVRTETGCSKTSESFEKSSVQLSSEKVETSSSKGSTDNAHSTLSLEAEHLPLSETPTPQLTDSLTGNLPDTEPLISQVVEAVLTGEESEEAATDNVTFSAGERVRINKPESRYHGMSAVVATATSDYWVKVLLVGDGTKNPKKTGKIAFHYTELKRIDKHGN